MPRTLPSVSEPNGEGVVRIVEIRRALEIANGRLDLLAIAVDERVSKRIAEYGEYAGEGFLVRDGFCFKLSGEEKMEGETPIRISFFTTFMPLSEMSDTQRDAIYEECVKGASMVVF